MNIRLLLLVALWLPSILLPAHAGQFHEKIIDFEGGGNVVWAGNDENTQIQISSRSWKSGQQPDGGEVNEKRVEFPDDTQVWLLRRDGTAIPRVQKPAATSLGSWGAMWVSEFHTFPASAAAEAYAVVVQFGGRLYTKKIPRLPK